MCDFVACMIWWDIHLKVMSQIPGSVPGLLKEDNAVRAKSIRAPILSLSLLLRVRVTSCFRSLSWPPPVKDCHLELWPNIRLYLFFKFLLGVYHSNKKLKKMKRKERKLEQADSIDRIQSLDKWVEGAACLVGRVLGCCGRSLHALPNSTH